MKKLLFSFLGLGIFSLSAMDTAPTTFEQTIIRKFFLRCAKKGRNETEMLHIYTKLDNDHHTEQDIQLFNAVYGLVKTGYELKQTLEKSPMQNTNTTQPN